MRALEALVEYAATEGETRTAGGAFGRLGPEGRGLWAVAPSVHWSAAAQDAAAEAERIASCERLEKLWQCEEMWAEHTAPFRVRWSEFFNR